MNENNEEPQANEPKQEKNYVGYIYRYSLLGIATVKIILTIYLFEGGKRRNSPNKSN